MKILRAYFQCWQCGEVNNNGTNICEYCNAKQ